MHLTNLINDYLVSKNRNVVCRLKIGCQVLTFLTLTFFLFTGVQKAGAVEKNSFSKKSKYYFNGYISREVLENYLDRSATMGYFLVHGTPENYQFPYREDDVRMIKNIGVKFVRHAIYR